MDLKETASNEASGISEKMKHRVQFINLKEDDKDLIVAFAVDGQTIGVRSLILHRTLFFEELLDEDDTMTINGSCFCGSVKYKVEGKLHSARSCHCSMCRKAFSSPSSAYALVEPDSLEWLSGESLLRSYESKHGAGLQFCSVCGSTLCGAVL